MLPLLGLTLRTALFAQWTHRYPKVAGFNHHVYLEGYELPVLNPGPSDSISARAGLPMGGDSPSFTTVKTRRQSSRSTFSSGEERVLVDEPALDLDPVYSLE